jgi:hypothetical protein
MNLIEQFKREKGYDAYAYDENEQGEPRVIGYCENYVEWIESKLKKLLIPIVSGSIIVNGFEIKPSKNADGKHLPPSFLQWKGEHLLNGQKIAAQTKKECIKIAESYH